ncbi:MAG: GxxExxY protein [Candidatus Brocadia carolinensis]|uniref:GxxExxY protein n=1 Tax=Candidatus Brocadia carolinensis TaxID=1004156 RepID=A0A1V4ARE1_9BACT|nr:MAG: GxxExxY protein [Candidatus Brocadia caroliniensis]
MTNHKDTKDTKRSDELSKSIIGAAIEVHRNLGPGLLESAYEKCLCYELASKRISFERQKNLPITYKDIHLDCGYRIDILVEKLVIIELKTVEHIESIHEAQLLTYLKLSDLWLGLLINFNVPVLKEGICRIAN